MVDGEGDGAEVLLDQARENVRAGAIQHVAEARVGLREKGRLVQRRRVLEADKLHRFVVPGRNDLSRDPPPHRSYATPDMFGEVRPAHILQTREGLLVERQGMAADQEIQSLQLVLQNRPRAVLR